ncbi:MAG: hypothetical protein KKD11_01360 [Candidatus Omnitrophica bacterium]|nr:hypothetical protein [Candidatus Omnitrophota bacterium]
MRGIRKGYKLKITISVLIITYLFVMQVAFSYATEGLRIPVEGYQKAGKILFSDTSNYLREDRDAKKVIDSLLELFSDGIKIIILDPKRQMGLGDEIIFFQIFVPIFLERFPDTKIIFRSQYPKMWKHLPDNIELTDLPWWSLMPTQKGDILIKPSGFELDRWEFRTSKETILVNIHDVAKVTNAYVWKLFFSKVFECRTKGKLIPYIISKKSMWHKGALNFINRHALDDSSPKIAMNLFGGEQPQKGFSNFTKLPNFITKFVKKTNAYVFIVMNERSPQGDEFERFKNRICELLGKGSKKVIFLPRINKHTASLITNIVYLCDAGITTEGGMLHLLYAFDKPFISIHSETAANKKNVGLSGPSRV